MGRYSTGFALDKNGYSIPLGLVSLAIEIAPMFQNQLDLKMSMGLGEYGPMTFTKSFGPQGRNFENALDFEGSAKTTLLGLDVNFGNVQFGSDEVTIEIAGQGVTFTKAQLQGDGVVDYLEEQLPELDTLEAGNLVEDILLKSMNMLEYVEEYVSLISTNFPQPTEFQAHFINVGGITYLRNNAFLLKENDQIEVEGEPETALEGGNEPALEDGTYFAALNENYVTVMVVTENVTELKVYHRESDWNGPVADIESYYFAHPVDEIDFVL